MPCSSRTRELHGRVSNSNKAEDHQGGSRQEIRRRSAGSLDDFSCTYLYFFIKFLLPLPLAPAPAFKLIHTHSVPTGHCRGVDCQRVRIQSAGVKVGHHVPQLLTRRTREPLAGEGTAQGPLGRAASQLTQGPWFMPVCLHAHCPHPQRALLDVVDSDDGAEASMRKGVAALPLLSTPSGDCREWGQGTGDPHPQPSDTPWHGVPGGCTTHHADSEDPGSQGDSGMAGLSRTRSGRR